MMRFLRYAMAVAFAMVAHLSMMAGEPYKVLTFPDDNQANNKCNNYTSTWEAKIGNNTWSITGFNNNNWTEGRNYIACGDGNATITSKETNYLGAISIKVEKNITNAKALITYDTENSSEGGRKVVELKEGEVTTNTTGAIPGSIQISIQSQDYADAVRISKISYYKQGEEPGTSSEYKQVNGLEDLFNNYTSSTSLVEVNFTNAKVLFTPSKTAAFIREGEKAVYVYNFAEGALKTNSILNGKVKFRTWTPGSAYLNAYGATCESITESDEPAQPHEATISEIRDQKLFKNDLVIIKNFILWMPSGTWACTTYGSTKNRVMLKGDYGVNDLADLTDGETYSAEGIVYDYSGADPILHLTKKVKETSTGISDITLDATTTDAPAYNLAGQKVGKNYKGVVIKAGKKMIQK